MAKITGNNPPLSDWEYQDATGDDHYFGEFYRQGLKEAFPSLADPDTDITGQSSRGARPSQQGEGTPKQSEIRKIFQDCAALWNSLPEECPEPPTDPPTTSKASVWQAKQDFGVVCSYLDLFMRCCITFALDNEGAMPDGDCFPCGPGCTCDGISIGYTTLGMGVDEEQTLTVEGAIGDCTYQWAIVSGGGELSGAEGFAVIYTAPATNPNCVNNATITLSVNDEVCDSITIAINASTYTGQAVRIVTQIEYPGASGGFLCWFLEGEYLPNTGECSEGYVSLANCRVRVDRFRCDGSLYSTCDADRQAGFADMKDGDGNFYLCADEAGRAAACQLCLDNTTYIYGCIAGPKSFAEYIANNPWDYRTEAQKAAGCCPEQFLL